ncbi:MAG: response regulator PleD [Candidatus Methanofastidiosum methylothiophilum]|uniref:Response regulator PleD n=1 Tax=Candidatus Methanofastidiosum methylothiophilum TaxID=1705564 RepID=A0A150J505_9EURY|nr:MAG: response regulator PleD [Candidatus Methanofastidiosum methylthiophilus]
MSKKVLIVDDEQDMVFGLRMMFEANNFEVMVAFDGQEALNIARQSKPDIMILDLMLPKVDGYRVCRMLKFDEKYRKIPIVILTARTSAEEMKIGMAVGADAYIVKPFDQQVLMDKVKALLKPSGSPSS